MASEKEGLQKQLEKTIERQSALRQELAITSNPNLKFDLKEQIEKIEREKSQIRSELHSLSLGGPSSKPHFSSLKPFFNRKTPRPRLGQISCDRHLEMKQMQRHFWDHQEEPFQHFFIRSQFKDKADSLVERFIKSVLEPEFDIDYPAEIQGKGYDTMLKVHKFPQSVGLGLSKQAFQRYLLERFHTGERMPTTLPTAMSDLLGIDLPILQKEYIICVFKLNREHRNEWLPDFLHWITHDFCRGRHARLKFLFFYTIVEDKPRGGLFFGIFGKRNNELDKVLLKIHEAMPCCCYLRELSWVPVQDLMAWFEDHSSHTWQAEQYIEQAKKEYKKHYDPARDAFRMHVVESFLEKIITSEADPAF